MKQLTLFPSPKPLVLRFGEDFFRSAPRSAGVYIMTGEGDRVLYIGQSKNLRARLGTYKNARPDCAPRKIVRLVHEVRSIVWEKCDSVEIAKSRESELLRVHRPKFNVAGTWPGLPRYFRIDLQPGKLEIDFVAEAGEETGDGSRQFGPFKASARAVYGAMVRLLWAAFRDVEWPTGYPAGFFSARPPRPVRLPIEGVGASGLSGRESGKLFLTICDFLSHGCEQFLVLLQSHIPGLKEEQTIPNSGENGRGHGDFHQTILGADFETLANFRKMLRRAPASEE